MGGNAGLTALKSVEKERTEIPGCKDVGEIFDGGTKMSRYTLKRRTRFGWMFTWVTVAMLALLCVAISAGPASNTGTLASGHYRYAVARYFHRSGFFGGDGFGGGEVTVEQSQSTPSEEPEKPDKKRIYVQPHWVDGGNGVQILEPGHWVDTEPGR
jgi:hypothetical protein